MAWIGIACAAVAVVGVIAWIALSGPAPAKVVPKVDSVATAPASAASTERSNVPSEAQPRIATAEPVRAQAPVRGTVADQPLPSAAITPAGGAYRAPAVAAVQNRLFLAGSSGRTRLLGAHVLSNGDLLLCGGTDDLGWTGVAPRSELPSTGLTRTGGNAYGFILRTSGDLGTLKHVYHFPKGAVGTISRIRSTEVPGQPTGTLFISGEAATFANYQDDGYYLARLDGNIVDAPLTKPLWIHEVKAGERESMGFKTNGWRPEGGYEKGEYTGDAYNKRRQPWDVRNDGGIVFVDGTANDFSWSSMCILSADGRLTAMPGWGPPGTEGSNMIPLKVPNGSALRSDNAADFSLRQDDENGNPGRKGAKPNDLYFSSHDSRNGPGYTGYQVGSTNTHRVGAITIDRRNNHLYFGYNQASKLLHGGPDFEPALVAMDHLGRMKWWARGYLESEVPEEIRRADWKTKEKWDLEKNSPPDQYFDEIAIDYSGNRLIVTGRAHGGGTVNFWRGDQIRANAGRPGFQRGFSGTNGNIHYCWMGAYDLDRLRITAATYVGELADHLSGFTTFPNGPLEGWPDPNSGWLDLNTTFIHGLAIDPKGRPLVVGIGKRSFTTRGSLIENAIPAKDDSVKAAWSPFARAYDADFGGIAYSTLVRGPWDSVNGRDDAKHEIESKQVIALDGGFLVLAEHVSGPGGGSTIPTSGVPAWGAARAPGPISAIVLVVKTP